VVRSPAVRKQRMFGVRIAHLIAVVGHHHMFGKKIWLQGSLLGRALFAGITNV
jgi:hypothetical protein